MNDPASPQGQALAESQRRAAETRQSWEAQDAMMAEQERRFKEAQEDYYRNLREENSLGVSGIGNFRDEDLPFLNQLRQAIEAARDNPDVDPQLLIERAQAARVYSNLFEIDIGTAFLNLENLHQQWTGQNFVRKTGIQAVMDSVQLSFLNAQYNNLSKQWARSPNDPHLIQALYEHEQRIDRLRDHAPKPWQDDYVSMGGFFQDAGQWLRAAAVFTGENAVQLAKGIGAAALAATGAGAIASAAGLSAGTSGLLISGAGRLAIMGSTYEATWGIKYRELRNAGFSHDIALSHAKTDAAIEGIIEGSLGGLEAAGGRGIAAAIVPQAVGRATNRWFISGKVGVAARHFLNWIIEGGEEFSEEFLQALSSGTVYNAAVDEHNRQREQELRNIYSEYSEDLRGELEKEILEKYPDIDKKELEEMLHEGVEGGIGAFLSALILGGMGEGIGYRSDVRSALQLAEMAQVAPNEAVFREMVEQAKQHGFQMPMAEMKSDEEANILSEIYRVQQERLTPEQREAKQKQAQDAAALAEVTDYSNTEVEEYTDEETGETRTRLTKPDTSNIYRENDKLYISENTDVNEDGSISGSFLAGDARIDDDEDQRGANQYGRINYTENGNTVTIDEFTMMDGHENLRDDLYDQFAERFAGMNIVWNPKNEQNIALRDQLVNNNRRGPKFGLNRYEKGSQSPVSNEARQIAQRFTKLMPKGTSQLEVAMAVELFNFARRKGETLTGAFNRLVGRVTNDPNSREDVEAAQRKGYLVQGATWTEKTAEGIRRVIYLHKNASNPSTVIHELLHIVEAEFTDAERRIAIRALNGRELKSGRTVYFDENFNRWTKEQWTDFSEALAEAGEAYFINGAAPSEEMKSLFEKIKEFMRRIYEKLKGWTELSPQVEEFYKKLFSGELADQARTEAQTHEVSHSEAQTEKTQNDTKQVSEAASTPQEANRAISPNTTQSHIDKIINSPETSLEEKAQAVMDALTEERTQQRDAIINDPDIPLEEKEPVVLDAAGDALYQVSEKQRSKIDHVINSDPILVDTSAIPFNGDIKQLKKDAFSYGKKLLGSYTNKSDNTTFALTAKNKHGSLKEVISHDHYDQYHLQSIAAIPMIATEAQFITSKANEDTQKHPGISEYRYYLSKIAFNMGEGKGNKEFIVKSVVSVAEDGKRYYDHRLTEMEKIRGLISSLVMHHKPDWKQAPDTINDYRLRQILQEVYSEKTLFQTGWHGTPLIFDKFDNSNVGRVMGNLSHGWGHTLYGQKDAAEWFSKAVTRHKFGEYVEGRVYEVSIPDDHELLHWEKPISEQAEAVQKAADKLISWKKDGTSNFNIAYNLKQFDDRSYGFISSINRKMKWGTKAEAQAAAKEEIKKTLTGKEFYNTLSDRIGAKRTSLLLDHLGVKGTKYLDKSIEKAGLKKGYNYVIYGDSDIQIMGAPREESRALVPYGMLFQAVFHGSPYEFESFDSSHIGEGEGTQAKGWGHYAASRKEVAEWYRKKLAKKNFDIHEQKIDGKDIAEWIDYWEKLARTEDDPQKRKMYHWASTIAHDFILNDFDRQETLDTARKNNNVEPNAIQLVDDIIKKFKPPGKLYEVEIPGDDVMLDWDKTLDEQPEKVKKALGNIVYLLNEERGPGSKNPDLQFYGSSIYGYISEARGSDKAASQYLNSIGIKGIRYLDGNSRAAGEGSHNYVIFDDREINITQTFFQTEDRNMMEEAAFFDSYKEWRSFTEDSFDAPMGDYEYERWTASEEQIDAWYKSFWENSKKAKEAEDKAQGVPKAESTPADIDREFKELIPHKFKDFFENSKAWINEDFSEWGAVDEEDAAERERQAELTDDLRKNFDHMNWTTAFKKKYGELEEGHRKRLLGMIKNSPREYRAIYAVVMNDDYFAVSPEDMKAEILKNKITDSRREKIDSMTPEQLRKLEEDIGKEEVARKLRTGKLKIDDPDLMAYIKGLNEEVKQKEQELKEAEADREEDNKYIENKTVEIFLESWDKVLKAKEEISRSTKELDRAVKDGERTAARIAWKKKQQAKASYDSIMKVLEGLNEQHHLELNIQAAIANEQIKEYAKSAKTQATLQKHIAVKAATEKLRAHLAELKEKQKRAKELTQAMIKAKDQIFKPANPKSVNAEQGAAIATIQRFIKPSMLKGLDRFMDGVNKPFLQEIFNRWKTDEKLRSESLEGKPSITQEKMVRLFGKEKFDDLTNEEIKYLSEKLPPKDWAAEFGMQDIADARNGSGRIEAAKQNLQKNLPQDVYYRIMDKPLSEWTLNEAQELAGIIGNLEALGRNIYKANIEAEQRRIAEYQNAIKKTIRTVIKKGMVINDSDEVEKIIGKYKGEDGGTAEGDALRRKHGLLNRYSSINVYRFARMLDNGDVNGKNMAALYRMESDAFNQKMRMTDARHDRVYKIMADAKIKEGELWELGAKINLGGDMGVRKFTKAELMGFAFASRNEYSREALLGGNLLTQREQEKYQVKGADTAALEELSAGRYAKLEQAAQKFIADNPQYQKLMDAIAQDLTVSGKRLAEYLVGYNNTIMPIVEFYFPMIRTAAVSADTADAKLARDLMGSSAGAFKLYVEKGFTEARSKIPIQYQTAIKLDIMAVWTEAVSQQEHFMAYGQAVKDLNKIYKQSRSVRDAIHSRYGREAVSYIDKYINEMANPNAEKTRSDLDKWVRLMRGNTAAAYLGWKTSSIVKQFITSPAPFFGYMNMAEYWGTFIEYTAHREDMWNQICELSPHMKHRSADMMQELVKEMAKQGSDNKAIAAMSKFNKMGMKGLEWIDEMCVAPGWMVLYRNEIKRLTNDPSNAKLNEKDKSVKAAQYADDIVRLTQPDSRLADLPPLFKGNSELGKAFLQFTQSLSNIYQQIRYDVPQQMRDKMFRRWAGTIIGYTIAGIMLGAITQGFDDDDNEEKKAKKIAWWATTQFTDSMPIIGSEVTRLMEAGFTGKARYQGSQTLIPGAAKLLRAVETGFKAAQEKDFDKSFKAMAQFTEAVFLLGGGPVSGGKELGALLGIGDDDGELDINPEALLGRR